MHASSNSILYRAYGVSMVICKLTLSNCLREISSKHLKLELLLNVVSLGRVMINVPSLVIPHGPSWILPAYFLL